MEGKSKYWRTGADDLLESLALDNKYIVADILKIFLDSAGYGLKDYSPLGGVFKRALKKGIISEINVPFNTRQRLWISNIYKESERDRRMIRYSKTNSF